MPCLPIVALALPETPSPIVRLTLFLFFSVATSLFLCSRFVLSFFVVVHVVALSGNAQMVGEIQYETDRSRFLGRGRSIRNPAALDEGAKLSGRVG